MCVCSWFADIVSPHVGGAWEIRRIVARTFGEIARSCRGQASTLSGACCQIETILRITFDASAETVTIFGAAPTVPTTYLCSEGLFSERILLSGYWTSVATRPGRGAEPTLDISYPQANERHVLHHDTVVAVDGQADGRTMPTQKHRCRSGVMLRVIVCGARSRNNSKLSAVDLVSSHHRQTHASLELTLGRIGCLWSPQHRLCS